MKYKVGDEVLIKARIKDMSYVDTMYVCELVTEPNVCIRFKSPSECIVTDKTYADGLNDAWELAKKIYDMKCDAIEEIFGVKGGFYEVIRNFTFEDCRDKIEAYEKEREIKVGDIVKHTTERIVGVVTKVTDVDAFATWTDGSCGHRELKDLIKTGKHIDIESLLLQIGE